MSTIEEMKAIQEKINDLHNQQQSLREKEKSEKAEEILKMNWLRGKTVKFEESGFAAAGIPAYTLSLVEKVPLVEGVLGFGGSMRLYGDSKHYEWNITLRNADVWGFHFPAMQTSSTQTLCKFISELDLKLDISKDKVLLYRTILAHLDDPGQ